MKLWEKFLGSLVNPIMGIVLRQNKTPTFELFLKRALAMLDATALAEIKTYIIRQQYYTGMFKDRAGNPDLYYSLFGYFLITSLELDSQTEKLKAALSNAFDESKDEPVHLFCGIILHSQLILNPKMNKDFKLKISAILNKLPSKDSGYLWFLGIVALFYLNEFYLINNYLRKFRKQINSDKEHIPSTLISVELILNFMLKKPTEHLQKKLSTYYRPTGGFAALTESPIDDLLSTAVCLYALNFTGNDLRVIKPDAIAFVDSLYNEGGFIATAFDMESDIEYTFYGLLALASLNNDSEKYSIKHD
jgi:prenyltransferase beta subunit